MKKLVAVLLCAMLALSLASCKSGGIFGGGDGSGINSEGFYEVKYALKTSQNEDAGWEAMISAANELLRPEKIKIVIERIVAEQWTDYYAKLATQMTGRTAPAIGRISESFIPQMLDKDQLADITDVVESLSMEDYYADAFEGVIKKGDRYYGLPTGIYHMVTFYNKNSIAGYNESHSDAIPLPSKDWENAETFSYYTENARKLTSGSGGGKVFGISAAPYMAYAGMYAESLGGANVFDANGDSALNSEEYYKVYEWFDGMLRTDASMPKPSDTEIMSAFDMFVGGKIGYMVDGTWWLPSFKNISSFSIGVAPPPTGRADNVKSSRFVDAFFMLRTAKEPEKVKKALRALMSVEAGTALAETGVGGIPVHRGALETYKQTISSVFDDAADRDALLAGVDYTVSVPYTPYYEKVDQRINQNMSDWLSGNRTYRWFVEFMHGELQAEIDKTKR